MRQNTNEWLEMRKNYIGASDAPPLYDSNVAESVSSPEPAICIQEEKERAEPDRINYLQKLLEGFDEERLTNFQNFFTAFSIRFKVETIEDLDSTACEWLIDKIEKTKENA